MTKPPVPSADAAVTRLALFGPPTLLAGEDAAAMTNCRRGFPGR
jgi:hypothetical protein